MVLEAGHPLLDVDAGRVVKGTNFVDIRDAGDPVELAERYDAEGADEIVFLDITASHENRDTIVELLARRTADNVFIPFTIGGGTGSVEDAQAVLDAGADKISVNSAALDRPQLISELAEVFGSQCVVIAIDAKRRGRGSRRRHAMRRRVISGTPSGRLRARRTDQGGRSRGGCLGPEATGLGAGEVLTSMDRDGTTDGYDSSLTRAVADAVSVPVIASGGAGELDHLVDAVERGHADAVPAPRSFTTARTPSPRRRGAWTRHGFGLPGRRLLARGALVPRVLSVWTSPPQPSSTRAPRRLVHPVDRLVAGQVEEPAIRDHRAAAPSLKLHSFSPLAALKASVSVSARLAT